MPLPGIMTLFGISDATITPMTADTASGGTTLGTSLQVPAIQQMGVSPETMSKDLKGPDGTIIDTYTKVIAVTGSVQHARISIPLLAAILGSTPAFSGVTPNQLAALQMNIGDVTGWFQLEGRAAYNSYQIGGDVHIRVYKAKMSKFKFEMKNEDYANISFDYKAVPRVSDGKLMDIIENEGQVPLTYGATSTTAPTVTSVVPAESATGVAHSAAVVWTLSEALAASSVNNGTACLVKTADGTNVPGAVALANAGAGTTVTFTPTSALSSATGYTAILTGMSDPFGNVLASPSVSSFTTT